MTEKCRAQPCNSINLGNKLVKSHEDLKCYQREKTIAENEAFTTDSHEMVRGRFLSLIICSINNLRSDIYIILSLYQQ